MDSVLGKRRGHAVPKTLIALLKREKGSGQFYGFDYPDVQALLTSVAAPRICAKLLFATTVYNTALLILLVEPYNAIVYQKLYQLYEGQGSGYAKRNKT